MGEGTAEQERENVQGWRVLGYEAVERGEGGWLPGYSCPNAAYHAAGLVREEEASAEVLRYVAERVRNTGAAGHGKAQRLRELAAGLEEQATLREAFEAGRALALSEREEAEREAVEQRRAEEAYSLGVAYEFEGLHAEAFGFRVVSLPAGEYVGELACAVYVRGRLAWVGEEAAGANVRTYWQSAELAGSEVAGRCAEAACLAADLAFPRERGVEVSERA